MRAQDLGLADGGHMIIDWRRRINEVLNGGGPAMVFQPIYSMEPHVLVGFEALSRFPEGSPIEWFVNAVRVGLSYDLEIAAMRNALERLPEVPYGVYLAVNVSPSSVMSSRFAEDIAPYDLSHVVLELTEHDAVGDYAELRKALDPWRSQGTHVCTPVGQASTADRSSPSRKGEVRVSIDDLGAGFASMRHVLWLAPDFMKLDIDLVRGIDRSRRHRALTSSLANFGAKMNVRLVAEGVETEAEYVTLRALDVHSVQGYFLGRPGSLLAREVTCEDLPVLISPEEKDRA